MDDVYVIVLFSTFTGLAKGDRVSAMSFINIPVSVVLGIALGIASGWFLAVYFKKVHVRDTIKVIIVLSISFILVSAENALSTPITFSALIAVMFMGIALSRYRNETAVRLSGKFNRLWVGAEVVLFVLVGASVDIGYALSAGAGAVILIFGVLIFRIAGVFVCLPGTNLNM